MQVKVDLLNEWEATGEKSGEGYLLGGSLRLEYKAPENAVGWYPVGFERANDTAFEAMGWYGLILEIRTDTEETRFEIKAELLECRQLTAEIFLHGAGTHKTVVRLSDFDLEVVKSNVWRFLKCIEVCGDGELISASLNKGEKICVDSYIRGKSGEPGDEVSYLATVYNCTDSPQTVIVKQEFIGWESLFARIEPSCFTLAENGAQEVVISVLLHDYMPPGGHESTELKFIPNGDGSAAETLSVKTLRRLPHPYIYHDKQGWKETKDKIEKYDKFKPGYERFIADADAWNVTPPNNERDYLYNTREEHYIMSCAYAYALSGERRYAEKLAKFFKYFTDEASGYPKKKKGCSQSYVQEGHFFQHLAIAYDIIHAAGVLTENEYAGVSKCFRIYMDILDRHLCGGHISNWLVSEITGALYCALAIEDINMALRFVFGTGGSIEHLEKGLFNDGWWYECSVGYNTWVSSMYIQTAHALLPFGYNILHTYFRPPYNKEVGSTYNNQKPNVRFGMYNEKWGGNQKNYVRIKDIFDAVLPFLDYRGVLFGICDSDEKKLEGVHFGSTYDLAYKYYKDPEYVNIIKSNDYADPVFGIAELPDCETDMYKKNAYADNIGIAMLRSQAEGREQREQIQAVLRCGSHGYAHGHFDRTELLSVMRYGRSFFNPEHVWWGYGHFMYKFYVQNSITKNMVVVDEKLQVPSDSKRTLFYSGKRIQAAAVETKSKWTYPPYGGMVYDGDRDLERRCKMNGSSLPKLENPPEYGSLTDFTEEITQKRVMAVMDDYIVLFDYLKGDKPHQFDSLFQIKGFLSLDGESIRHTGHKNQFTSDPLSDGQFITDCACYDAEGTSVARFMTVFGEGEDLRGTRSRYNEPGVLKMDIHTAWPRKTQQFIGLAAEDHDMRIPLRYSVEADGRVLADGEFGAWILGEGRADIDIAGVETLALRVLNKPMYNENNYPYHTKQGLFWGEAYIVTRMGEKKDLYELELSYENIDHGCGVGRDYEGGRVLIAGNEYKYAIPTSPLNHDSEGIIMLDIRGLDAVRFVGVIGADAFPGDESQRRRTYAVRQNGETGRFITVVEPYEDEGVVRMVSAAGENERL